LAPIPHATKKARKIEQTKIQVYYIGAGYVEGFFVRRI
jgi:hypothetical protein